MGGEYSGSRLVELLELLIGVLIAILTRLYMTPRYSDLSESASGREICRSMTSALIIQTSIGASTGAEVS